MDLIYADETGKDLGVLQDCEFDLAYGADENNFACTVELDSHCCSYGYFLHMDGTEYGGVIDALKIDTRNSDVTYSGRTWHGILEGRILCPDENQDYLVLNGEANAVLRQLVARMGLAELFVAAKESSGIQIRQYKMGRYVNAYRGIREMLMSVGAKLVMQYENGQVTISAVPLVDYSKDEEWDSSQLDFVIAKKRRAVNHVVCLGKGELSDREVVHLYADEEGNVSKIQSFFGADEVTEILDEANAESTEELEESGRKRLQEAYAGADSLEVNFQNDESYDIGDVVGAREEITGTFVSREIVKKIVTINKKGIHIECQVGE